VILSDLAKC